MKRAIFAILTISLFVVTGWGIWSKLQSEKVTPPFPIEIAFTADTSGRIEPCGCFTGQYGGLTRVSTHLGPANKNRLLYEIGDALAGNQDFQVVQYTYLLRAYHEMHYTAINLGHREAQLSAQTLKQTALQSEVPLISANLLDNTTHEPIVKPWVISEISSDDTILRIATIGVVDPQKMNHSVGKDIEIASMSEALRRQIPAMKEQADLLVCLAFTDKAGIRQLAEEFYEFSFILGGDVPQPSQNIEKINQSWTLATTNQARALGEISAQWLSDSASLEKVTGKVTLMSDHIPQDPIVQAHSKQYRDDIRHIKLASDTPGGDASQLVPGVQASSTYVGSQACATCHAQAFTTWNKSGHAQAFQSLQQTLSDADPACIKCHTVGFGQAGGYLRSMGASQLTGVGCESCHGPASEHVRLRTLSPDESLALKMRPVGAGQCTQCHQGEFSRPFNWDVFWQAIQHGKEK